MSGAPSVAELRPAAAQLADFLTRSSDTVVITGAGCSTASGIPAYRDEAGVWRHPRPMLYQDFVASLAGRQRYWARSMAGWPRFAKARPNPAHTALATLEAAGRIRAIVTQNVDGLHQAAGSVRVTDLHGSLAEVVCLACERSLSRANLQRELEAANPDWPVGEARPAPDGDAGNDHDCSSFRVPECPACGGTLKPNVVFFGESVPARTTAAADRAIADCAAVLVVGSSLAVFSGFRLVRSAFRRGIPVAAVNLGQTRAEELLTLRIKADCTSLLTAALAELDLAQTPRVSV